jgi:hypothetical protein
MKKKVIFVALLTVLLAVTFMSCQEDIEKTVVITGIPASGNGGTYSIAAIGLGDSKGNLIAMSQADYISSGQFTGKLYVFKNKNITDEPFVDVGTYNVALVIYASNDADDPSFSGRADNILIEEETTKVTFSKFRGVSASINFLELVK